MSELKCLRCDEDLLPEGLSYRKREIELLIDGRPIPLKPYVQATLCGVICGFIENLKMVDGGRNIEIRIRLPKGLRSERRKP